MHRLLARQIRKHLRGLDTSAPGLRAFLDAVDQAYQQADADRSMVERSLELSSAELLQIAEDLKVAEKKFRSIFENATEGIFQVALDGRFIAANPAMAGILGYPSEQALLAESEQGAAGDVLDVADLSGALGEATFVPWRELEVRRRGGELIWIGRTMRLVRDDAGRPMYFEGTSHEVTQRVRAEQERRLLQARLLETSRAAGMAAVATNVVHNIGNTLNSMNVSVDLAKTRLQGSKLPGLGKALQLIHEHREDLGRFFTQDPRGEQLIEYMNRLSRSLGDEQRSVREELDRLALGLEHVKRIVTMQQGYARVSGVREEVQVADLVKDAVGLNRIAATQTDVEVVYDLKSLPPVSVDKHDVMQILVNLLSNAQDAMRESTGRKVLKLYAGPHPSHPARFFIQVQDTGIGIPSENLVRIFSHGFTTKADGHGFGLHGAALAANSMGGRLYAASEGVNRGATFTLELPLNAGDEERQPEVLEGVA